MARRSSDHVSADRAGVIIHDGGQPGAVGLPVRADDENVEFGVVGLPDVVRPFRPTAEHQLVTIAVGRGTFQRGGDERWVEGLHDLPDGRVARRRFSVAQALLGDEAMQRRDRRTRPGQSDPLYGGDGRWISAPTALIGPRSVIEPGEPVPLIELMPTLERPRADAALAGEGRERDLIFDVKSEDPPPLEAVHEPLHRCALAGRAGLPVAVERRATPPDETSGVLGGAAARSRVGGDYELVRDDDRV